MKELLIVLVAAGAALAQTPSYVGAAGCKSSNCHGGTAPLPLTENSRVQQNEFTLWSTFDKHKDAYKVLTEPRGKRMSDILRISNPTTDKRCAVCHVDGSPDNLRSDGVACEACHGPASGWKDTHEAKNSHADSVRKGMVDVENPAVRSSKCLTCHLGTGDKIVDHELIAAGHPDLAFEMGTFDYAMPAHHRQRDTKMRVQAWAIGQANGLADGMRLLTTHSEKGWPEFSDLECYQCHHDLRKESWRINLGYASRKPGSLRVNLARYEVTRVLVATAAPDQSAALQSAFARLTDAVSNRFTDGAGIAAAARGVEKTADDLTKLFMSPNSNVDAKAVLQALTTNIQTIANAGVNSAEQATMSLDALTLALNPNRSKDALGPLYDYLEHPSAYTPSGFADKYRQVAGRVQ
jgi:hypothetical protein